MECFPGKEPDSIVYYYEGYMYHRNSSNSDVYQCSMNSATGCRGVIQIVDGRRVVPENHNMHPPDLLLISELRFRQEVLRRCRESLDACGDIFREVSVMYPEGAARVSLISMRSSMERARHGVRLPIYESLSMFLQELEEIEAMRSFYRGCARSADNDLALVFASQEMIQRLSRAIEIFVASKIRVVPNWLNACQLFVIYIHHMQVEFPVAFVLYEQRTTAMFEAVFRFLLNLVPELAYTLQSVVSEYDRAIIAAVRTVFPETRLRGCWFYFSQAVFKKWRELMPRNAPRDLLWMIMAIPLLPYDNSGEALAVIATLADQLATEHPAILQILHYYRRQWLPLADVVWVGRTPVRTNNVCESFHRYICKRLGGRHPSIWVFLYKLDILMDSLNIDLLRVETGERIRRGRSRRQLNDDLRLALQQHDLESGRIQLEEFLRIAVLPRQRRAAAATDYIERAQGNVEISVELPTRDDFPARGIVDDHGIIQNRVDVPQHGLFAPGDPAAQHVEVQAPQVNVHSDDDDEYLPGVFALRPNPPRVPVVNDEAIVISDDDGEHYIAVVISSDDEDDGDVVNIGNAAVPQVLLPAPVLQPLVDEPRAAAEVPEISDEEPEDAPAPELAIPEEARFAVEPALGLVIAVPDDEEDELAPEPAVVESDDEDVELRLNRCSICLRGRPSNMFLPCRHLVTCNLCSTTLLEYGETCPICRVHIERCVRVFYA